MHRAIDISVARDSPYVIVGELRCDTDGSALEVWSTSWRRLTSDEGCVTLFGDWHGGSKADKGGSSDEELHDGWEVRMQNRKQKAASNIPCM